MHSTVDELFPPFSCCGPMFGSTCFLSMFVFCLVSEMLVLASVCVSMCACRGPEADVAHLPQLLFHLSY